MEIQIRRMWRGGPLCQFSDKPFRGSIPIVGGHAGGYVCDIYNHITPFEGEDGGIRRHGDKWLCAPCGERYESEQHLLKRRLQRQTLKNQPNSQVFVGLGDRKAGNDLTVLQTAPEGQHAAA